MSFFFFFTLVIKENWTGFESVNGLGPNIM